MDNKHLKDTSLVLPKENKYNYHSYYVYVVQHPNRDLIIKKLARDNIYCNISYPFPIHLMKGYSYLNYKKGDYPITEKISKRIFSLPMDPNLDKKKLYKIVKCIKKICQ